MNDLRTAQKLDASIIKKTVADTFYNIANEYLNQKKYNESIEVFSDAINLNPSDAEAHYNRAIAYYYVGQTDLACEGWNKAKKLGLEFASEIIQEKCK